EPVHRGDAEVLRHPAGSGAGRGGDGISGVSRENQGEVRAPREVRHQLRLASLVVLVLSTAVFAGQPRSLASGVYSAAQAARGEQIYRTQCGSCHGAAMEGAVGPPLVGQDFLANWSERPIADVVDKIQKTMPFEAPGSLSTQQSADLTAYILQVGKFPSGQSELTGATLAQIVMPVARGNASRSPEGNLAELMRAIAFPNANIIFNLQLKNPSATKPKPLAASPFDYVEWGST